MNEINTNIAETFDSKRVFFYECDHLGRLKISEILKIASEIAGHDYTEKGLSHEFLWENNMVFLVSKVSFHIFQYPKSQMQITFSTWENGKKGAQFIRGFQIKGDDGTPYVEGRAGWILVDPATRKIIKPSDFPYSMPQILDRQTFSPPIGKITAKDAKILGNRTVRISDLDENGHVYNGNYADIATDILPLEFYEKDISDFRINFVSETMLGDNIELFGEINDIQAVIIGKHNDRICFECEFTFK